MSPCIQVIKLLLGSSLVAQWVKDLALSLLWLRSLLWRGFDSWPQELPHALGTAKKKKLQNFGGFSPVNLFEVYVILRPVRRTTKDRGGKFFLPDIRSSPLKP